MTAKRFVDYFDKDHNYIIQDLQNEDEYQVGFVNCDEDVFLELINQLNNENEQLKTTIQQLRTDNTKQKKLLNTTMKENEQLKEHQRTLEAKIVRLKDRVKTFEKHYSLKDIERYKKMDNCNCIDSRRLEK